MTRGRLRRHAPVALDSEVRVPRLGHHRVKRSAAEREREREIWARGDASSRVVLFAASSTSLSLSREFEAPVDRFLTCCHFISSPPLTGSPCFSFPFTLAAAGSLLIISPLAHQAQERASLSLSLSPRFSLYLRFSLAALPPGAIGRRAEGMAERVHPRCDTPPHPAAAIPAAPAKAQKAPSAYVIKVPKEQILRVPTPDTERKFKEYTRRHRRRRRSCCCRCLCWLTGVALLLSLALAATAGILYLVYRPKLPKYSVENLSIKGFTLKPEQGTSPEFVVTVRAENPNKKIGIDYRGGSSVAISYSGVDLATGAWPTFYQGPRRVDVFQAALTGSVVHLSSPMYSELEAEQRRRQVPLQISTKVPVRIKFGAVTTWTVTAKVRCAAVVDGLTASSKILSSSCRARVKIL